MDIKNSLLAVLLAASCFSFWLADLYGMLLVDFMKNHPVVSGYNKAEPDMMYLVIGNLLSGLLMAYIFVKAGVNTLAAD